MFIKESNMTDEPEKSKEELELEYLRTMIWQFSQQPTGFYNQLGLIKEKLQTLNVNLEQSSNSSEHLAKALNRLTLAGVIVAGLGVIAAIGHLILDIIKYTNGQ